MYGCGTGCGIFFLCIFLASIVAMLFDGYVKLYTALILCFFASCGLYVSFISMIELILKPNHERDCSDGCIGCPESDTCKMHPFYKRDCNGSFSQDCIRCPEVGACIEKWNKQVGGITQVKEIEILKALTHTIKWKK